MHRFALAGLSGMLLLCAGCKPAPVSRTDPESDVAAAPTPSPSPTTANAAANGVALGGPEANSTDASPAKADLAAYVGKYPFDKVGGVSFLELPAVRTAVNGAVPDAGVREWIFEKAGPQSPIVLKDGTLLAWGCEAHNCGAHNWTIAIVPAGTSAEVCYFDETADSGQAKWYLPGGTTEMRKDSCPSGDS